jgi:hypothetical protein
MFGGAQSGALISAIELPNIHMPASFKYIGYVDIFDTKQFRVSMMTWGEHGVGFREANAAELSAIKNKRMHVPKPSTAPHFIGILEPTHFKKQPNQPYSNLFKIIGVTGTDPKVAASTKGAACNTKTRAEIDEYLLSLGIPSTGEQIKDQLCFTLGVEMFKKGRLFVYPEWKPKI